MSNQSKNNNVKIVELEKEIILANEMLEQDIKDLKRVIIKKEIILEELLKIVNDNQ